MTAPTEPGSGNGDFRIFAETYGPYKWLLEGDPPSDNMVYGALDRFGAAYHLHTSPTGREVVRASWVDYLRPLVPEAWRVVDRVIKGGTVSVTAPVEPPQPRTLAEMLADPELEDEAEWLVPGYVGRGILTLVSGHPKVGKTTFLAHLAMAVASRGPFLGGPTAQAPVLWVDLEQHPRRLTALFKMLISFSYKGFSCAESIFTISTRPSLEQLAEMITKTGAGLVVVDSLFKLLGVEDENDATAVNQAMAPLLEMTRETNVALVPIHHLRKSGGSENTDVRGSSAINAIVDISVAIRRLTGGSDTSRELEAISRYSDTPARLVVELKDGTYHRRGTVAEVRAEQNEARVLEALTEEPATAAVIGDAAGLKEGTARKALNALHGKGLVSREGTGKRVTHSSLLE